MPSGEEIEECFDRACPELSKDLARTEIVIRNVLNPFALSLPVLSAVEGSKGSEVFLKPET